MRSPIVAYTLARFAVFVGVAAVLYVIGARDVVVIIVLAALFSGLLSLVLLARQRRAVADHIDAARSRTRRPRGGRRLDAGATSEDE